MQGIWSLPVSLSYSSLDHNDVIARIVFQCFSAAAILFAWAYLPSRLETGRNPGVYSGLLSGVYFLIAWYTLTIADLFFHEFHLQAAYGYILIYFPTAGVKLAADILILSATHRLVSAQLYQELKKPSIWIVVGEFQTVLLLITGLFYLGGLLAHESVWLNVADPDAIGDVAGRKDQWELAFYVFQFLFSLFSLGGCVGLAGIFYKRQYPLTAEVNHILTATVFLWIRSTSELVTVAHYHFQKNAVTGGSFAGRDFVYGFCTFAFLLLIGPVVDYITSKEVMDPVLKQMREDCHQHIMNVVRESVDAYGRAPTLTEVFQNIRQDPDSALTQDTRQALRGKPNVVVAYIDRLEIVYGGLLPVVL